jgi:predicted patatin/cPLA2 family phospholipase
MSLIKNIKFDKEVLVIAGGGEKGIAYIGALEYLEDNTSFKIKNLKILSGSSIGGIICFAITIGMKLDEIKKRFLSEEFINVFKSIKENDSKIIPLITNYYSITDGKDADNLLRKLFIDNKYNYETLTFKELYEKTNKNLILTGSNLNKRKCEYFCYKKTPNMNVFTALRITSRLPFIFPFIKLNNNIYTDGHIFDSFPIKGCGSSKELKKYKGKILGIRSEIFNKNKIINNFKDYTFSIIEGLLYQYTRKSIGKNKKYTIVINIEYSIFNMGDINKNLLYKFYDKGKEEANKFINNLLTHNVL